MSEYHNQTVFLPQLLRSRVQEHLPPILEGARFVNCVIEGPAVLLPVDDNGFDGCSFDGTADTFMTVEPGPKIGMIGLGSCVFIDCDFVGIGVAIDQNSIMQVLGDLMDDDTS